MDATSPTATLRGLAPLTPAAMAPWLAALGAACCLLLLALIVSSPGLVMVAGPLLLAALGGTAIAAAAALVDPPRWSATALIVFAFVLTDTSLRKGGVQAGGFDAQSIFKGMVWVVALAYGLVHGTRVLATNRLLVLLALYCGFAFLSAFYSKARALGLGSGIALLAIATSAGVIARFDEARLHALWRSLFWAIAAMAALSLVSYFALPAWGRDYLASGAGRLRGVTGSGNSLGPILSIGVIAGVHAFATVRTAGWRTCQLAAIGVMLVGLVLTESRGSMIGLLASFVVLASIGRPLVALASSLVVLLGLWLLLLPGTLDGIIRVAAGLFARSGAVQEISTFTGRSDLWAALVPRWTASPWIGYGLGSPRLVVSEAYRTRWGTTYESAHNWLLESLLSFGLAGTTLLVAFLGTLFVAAWRLRRAARAQPDGAARLALAHCVLRCWLLMLVGGLVEKSFAGMPSPSTVLFALMAGTCAALASNASATRREVTP